MTAFHSFLRVLRVLWNIFCISWQHACVPRVAMKYKIFQWHPEEVGHGPKRLMGNDLLITRAFSLTRWLSRSKHLLGKQDGRFWKSEGTKGQRYFIKIALKLKLLWSILRFLFGFLNFSVFKVQCAFLLLGLRWAFELTKDSYYFQERSTSSKFDGLESPCIIHVKASTIFHVGLYFEKSTAF